MYSYDTLVVNILKICASLFENSNLKKLHFYIVERTAKLAYVDSYVKPPREVRRQQLKYGTAGPSSGERAKKFAHLMDPIAIGRKEREERGL